MADGKDFEVKLVEVVKANSAIMDLLATDANATKAFYVGRASPTGVRYPSLHFEWIELESQEKLPTTNGTLRFEIIQEKDSTEKYKTFVSIRKALNALFNRNIGQPLTEIDVPANEGLRVVRILREVADFGYRENVDKHYSTVFFDIIKSEDEDFTKDFGNGSWC